MGWFKSNDGSKSKVSSEKSGGVRYEKISKPSSGGRHDHSIIKSNSSGESKFIYKGANSKKK